MEKLTLNQIKNKKNNEKEAYLMMKDLLNKPKALKPADFKPGKMVMYAYAPKFDMNPYDKTPLIIVLGRSRKYTLGLSWNWTPPKAREKVMDFIMKKNKKNLEKGIPIELSYDMIKAIIKGLGPVVRLYLNNRISKKGVSVSSYQYYKAIHLRAENFIGISSEQAWKMAKIAKKNKKAKKKKK